MKIPPPEKDNSYSPDEDSLNEDENAGSAPDFEEYMWMENEEEFDKEVMKQLEEEDLLDATEPTEKAEKPNEDPDFSEFLWMENEEEFDKEVMKQFEEDALMEQCIEAMLEDELKKKNPFVPSNFIKDFEKLGVEEKANLAKKSTLNPDAAEFVPRSTAVDNAQAVGEKKPIDTPTSTKLSLNNR